MTLQTRNKYLFHQKSQERWSEFQSILTTDAKVLILAYFSNDISKETLKIPLIILIPNITFLPNLFFTKNFSSNY